MNVETQILTAHFCDRKNLAEEAMRNGLDSIRRHLTYISRLRWCISDQETLLGWIL